jgi:GntR family transcriptional regulator
VEALTEAHERVMRMMKMGVSGLPAEKKSAYERIASDLRARVLSGELSEGAQLPSVSELRESYGVNTSTVTRALDVLKAEGHVVARQGAGVFVRRFRAIRRSSPGRLSAERRSAGLSIRDADMKDRERRVDVVVETVEAPEWVTEAFGVTTKTPIVARSWRFVVDDQPVQTAVSYYLADMVRSSRIMETSAGPGGSYARLAELGFSPNEFTEHLRARMPLPRESQDLELPQGTPVVEIIRYAFTESRQCVNVNRMVLDATAYVLDYTFNA